MSEEGLLKIVQEPAGGTWGGLIEHFDDGERVLGRTVREWREVTRGELGLKGEGRLILTGHQPVLWHPGVLAKYFAAESFAEAVGGWCANLVIDTHEEAFGEVEIPVRDGQGRLGVRKETLVEGEQGVAMCAQGTKRCVRVEVRAEETWEFVRAGLKRMQEAIDGRGGEANAAMQMARAAEDVRTRLMGGTEGGMQMTSASELMKTSLWRAMAEQMVKDARNCAETYNAAVQKHAEARVEHLSVAGAGEGVELPVWAVGKDGRRRRGFEADVSGWLKGESGVTLQPRALLTTAIVRLGVADLFIHGRGGGIYDGVMEEWIEQWLGARVAPMTVVSADVLLPLGVERPGEGGVEGAIARARGMEHDPPLNMVSAMSATGISEVMGTFAAAKDVQMTKEMEKPAEWKRAWVRKIAGMERGSAERRSSYREMHEEIAKRRAAAEVMIIQAREEVEEERRRSADWSVAVKRDWAFALYPEEQMRELWRAIASQFK